MWFLIRSSFWLSLALLALPLGAPDGKDGASSGMDAALAAARSAAADLSGMCERSAETCEAGRIAAGEVARRAQKAAQIAARYFDGETRHEKSDAAIETGSVN